MLSSLAWYQQLRTQPKITKCRRSLREFPSWWKWTAAVVDMTKGLGKQRLKQHAWNTLQPKIKNIRYIVHVKCISVPLRGLACILEKCQNQFYDCTNAEFHAEWKHSPIFRFKGSEARKNAYEIWTFEVFRAQTSLLAGMAWLAWGISKNFSFGPKGGSITEITIPPKVGRVYYRRLPTRQYGFHTRFAHHFL